jgi:hypothetical protein
MANIERQEQSKTNAGSFNMNASIPAHFAERGKMGLQGGLGRPTECLTFCA